jgi:chromosomal replication initiation ATPase DnaA
MKKAIYLMEATLPELLAEVQRRFVELDPIPEWAAPVVFAVTSYYGLQPEQLRSKRRQDAITKPRHLAIALLAQMNPGRTRAEICSVLGLEHHMYAWAIQKTEERVARFPDFRAEVHEILQILRETGHCRTSPHATSAAKEIPLSSGATNPPPA